MGAGDLQVVAFTLQMAATATAAILVPGVAAAFFLARYRGPGRSALETLLSLPLVLLSRLAPLERRDRGIRAVRSPAATDERAVNAPERPGGRTCGSTATWDRGSDT